MSYSSGHLCLFMSSYIAWY